MIRKDWNDQIFRTSEEKDKAIVKKIIECNSKGQPLLIFTASINKSEHYSNLLKKKGVKHTVLNAKNHEREAEIIAGAGKKYSTIITTSISGRGVDIKLGGKTIEEQKNEKEEIKSLGGLYVIGTERMESRRVDNQARGRSGRQGDEGNAIFYVSLEDDLMRIFGSESINNVLQKLGLKDGESIDHPWINKALERAQQKVEARNFDIRKTLLKFDNVLNDQRQVIFTQRNNVINNKESLNYSENFLEEIVSKLIALKEKHLINPKNSDFFTQTKLILGKNFEELKSHSLENITNNEFKNKIKNIFNKKRIEREQYLGKDYAEQLEKKIFLQLIDQNWKSHIQYLEHLRSIIGLRSYGQRDPLIEYKKEAFQLFENLLDKLKTDLITVLMNLAIIQKKEEEIKPIKTDLKYIKKKIGRNEPCFCGSGKKYKHCCGAL